MQRNHHPCLLRTLADVGVRPQPFTAIITEVNTEQEADKRSTRKGVKDKETFRDKKRNKGKNCAGLPIHFLVL